MTTTTAFEVPQRNEVSENNQAIFDQLENQIGFVPNLYAYYAKNDTALKDYLALQHRKSTLRAKEREVINLVTSEFNQCQYCLAAHTAIGKMNGFTDEQILEIRSGKATFDTQLDALAKFTLAVVEAKGKVADLEKSSFLEAGFTEAQLIDTVIVIGDKIISNYIHNIAQFEVDFPLAEKL